jgi:hypothetical protein
METDLFNDNWEPFLSPLLAYEGFKIENFRSQIGCGIRVSKLNSFGEPSDPLFT